MTGIDTNKIIKWTAITGLTAFVILAFIFFRSCNKKYDTKSTISQIEAKAATLKLESDSIKGRIDTVFITRTKVIFKYKEVRRDSLIPCETKLLVCDTVIKIDSVLISEFQIKNRVDSMIISAQNIIIDRKNAAISDTTKYFRKEVRRGKVRSFLKGFGLGFAAGAVARELKP